MIQELKKIANNYNIHFFGSWGLEGGNGWIWYKQDDEKKFKVQIFIHGDFNVYRNIKGDIVKLFESQNCSLLNEEDLGVSFGYKRNLYFIDTEEFNALIEEKENRLKMSQTPTYNIGEINADGGIVTLGNVINSVQTIDNSIHQIEKLIEEKGGEDKEELYATLNDAKEIIKEISETKEIKPNKRFIEKLSNHLAKHGWFYGAVVELLGTLLITILG